jgi:hypothetical protein
MVEHAFAGMKTYKVRDSRVRSDGLHHAIQAVADLHNLALATRTPRSGHTRLPAFGLRDTLQADCEDVGSGCSVQMVFWLPL